MDDAAQVHGQFRTASMPPELAEIHKQMLAMAERLPQEEAHHVTRGLVLAHFDAYLRDGWKHVNTSERYR